VAVAAGLLLAAVSPARADTITTADFSGSYSTRNYNNTGNDVAAFSGSAKLTVTSSTSATLAITLQNTSPNVTGNGAYANSYITGFGFNVPNGVTAAATTTPTGFNFLKAGTNTTTLQPGSGSYDYAFSLSKTELHTSGDPSITASYAAANGLGTTDGSATFIVQLTGNVSGLTAFNLLNEKTSGGYEFSVRFRSGKTSKYDGKYGDGDKVELDYKCDTTPPNQPPTNPVPAPPGLVLAGMGFGCMLLGRIRFRRK
jgi:hypothetical protein